MKRLLVFLIVSVTVLSCGSKNRGELIGVKQKKWFGEKPFTNYNQIYKKYKLNIFKEWFKERLKLVINK